VTDIVDRETRSRMMSGIKGKDTLPELLVRRELFARGFRYRLHYAGLPGKPDLVFPKYRAAIFVNGCFWHGHDCHLFKFPSTRQAFWRTKIERNRQKDAEVRRALHQQGWRTLTIWECALKGRTKRPLEVVLDLATSWLCSSEQDLEIGGTE
jgi:DNA mismatch endonuclease, patch repair protein